MTRTERESEESESAHSSLLAAAAPLSSVQTANTQEQLKDAADVEYVFLKLGENTVQVKNTDERGRAIKDKSAAVTDHRAKLQLYYIRQKSLYVTLLLKHVFSEQNQMKEVV